MRLLYAVSSVGLGHVARSRAIAEALKRINPSVTVDFLAPPPTNTYLEAWGWKPHPVSTMLEPLSPIVEEFYEKTGRARISLRMALREHKVVLRNARLVEEQMDFEFYDGAVLDESWELLESPKLLKSSITKIHLADFLTYPYKPSHLPVALVVNRFLKRRLERMDLCIFVGFPEKLSGRWLPLFGEKLSDWARRKARIVGPVPPILREELLPRHKARSMLGIDEASFTLLVSLGGTKAGREIIGLALRGAAELSKRLGEKIIVVLAPGASLEPHVARMECVRTIILRGLQRYVVPRLLKAFDSSVTLAGLTTITGLAAAGVPGVLVPLPGHFEQEENAALAVKRWRLFRRLRPQDLNPAKLASYIIEASRSKPSQVSDGLFNNLEEAAAAISEALKQGSEGKQPKYLQDNDTP